MIFVYNSPKKNCYNTKIYIVTREERMEFHTTKTHSQWQNKAESVIIIIKGKYMRRRVHKNLLKIIWYFVMILEDDIYYHTAGKDGHLALECLTGDTIYISE